MDNPKISIITATYNSAATVTDTLNSVSKQTYPHIEHLVIDGLSKDDSVNICRSFDHVAKIQSEKDNGIYDAMNKGISLATGDIIGILNSDDFYINNEVIEKVANAFKDDVDAVYGDLQYVDPFNTNKVIRSWRSGNYTARDFLYGWMPPHPTFFVRREVYERIGSFNTALHSAADYEFMLRVLFKHKLRAAYIPEVLVRMRAGGLSNASLKNRMKANLEDRLAWKMNGLKPYFFTLYLKPVRKILQYIIK